MKPLLLLVAFCSFALFSCEGPNHGSGSSASSASGAAKDFKLKTLNGEEVSLARLKGKPVFLVFWAVG